MEQTGRLQQLINESRQYLAHLCTTSPEDINWRWCNQCKCDRPTLQDADQCPECFSHTVTGSEYNWESLVAQFGLDSLIQIAAFTYGRDLSHITHEADLYNELWSGGHLENFIHHWNFPTHYYNLFQCKPDTDDLLRA